MKAFMDEDFLLTNETAKRLFHEHAEQMPIVDFHCHINPAEIAQNRKFENISQAWLGGDHYKWKLMRSNGVDEKYVTGSAGDREKFQAFAETLPKAIGNPLYHWTHLELKKYFGYDGILNGETAEEVWNLCNEKLKTDALSVRGIIEQSNVEVICTTDDPVDTLEYHRQIQNDPACKVKVFPAWRPDKVMNVEKEEFAAYVKKLEEASGVKISSFDDVCKALEARLDYFDSMGCRASDHGLNAVNYAPASKAALNRIFQSGLKNEALTVQEIDQYKYEILLFLAKEYAKRGWVMELHYGTSRDTNAAMYQRLGPDTGFDCISPEVGGRGLAPFFNVLFQEGKLPKTMVYSLNPNDNLYIDSVIGCFQGTEAAGKLQHGAAWWFNDTKGGMLNQMTSLASLSVLGNFVGMLTDSRSFLSYTRHDYFRRILCNLFGEWVENGEYPNDLKTLGQLVQDISYNNAIRYFNFKA